MQVFTLTKSNAEEPELFILGDEGNESVLVFASEELANAFLNDMDLADEFEATTLEPIELPYLMVDCSDQNVPKMVVNPKQEDIENDDAEWTVLDVNEMLKQFGISLAQYIVEEQKSD